MKYLKLFNESAFEGEDFFYKEIDVIEYRKLQLDRDRSNLDEKIMNKIYDMISIKTDNHIDKSMIIDDGSWVDIEEKKWYVGFYKFTIIHMDEDVLYIIPLEDEWYLVEFKESEWSQDEEKGGYSKDKHFYICDAWDGLTKFIEDKI
jgi:hypothetical protein